MPALHWEPSAVVLDHCSCLNRRAAQKASCSRECVANCRGCSRMLAVSRYYSSLLLRPGVLEATGLLQGTAASLMPLNELFAMGACWNCRSSAQNLLLSLRHHEAAMLTALAPCWIARLQSKPAAAWPCRCFTVISQVVVCSERCVVLVSCGLRIMVVVHSSAMACRRTARKCPQRDMTPLVM